MRHPHESYMRQAIEEARRATHKRQYPIGALVVKGNTVYFRAHTSLHRKHDPSAHAEMDAIRGAARRMRSRYLQGAWLYTTQEPCPMCTAAAIWAKMAGIVYGATKDDALRIFQKQKRKRFTWRQIDIPAEHIIAKGKPKLRLYKRFLRDDCLKLYSLSKGSV